MRLLSTLLATIIPMTAINLDAAPAPLGAPHIYKQLPDRELRIYAHTPDGWKTTDQRPAIVLFHGGAWTKGAPHVLNDQAAHCASLGLVTFLVEYRLLTKPDDTPELCVRDAKSAMRWVRSHADGFGVDPDRIAAGGGSAGAHLAASAAVLPGLDDPADDLSVSPKPQALVLFNPVIDNGPGGWGHGRVKDRYPEFSPAHNITADAPPTLILSGTADTTARPELLQKFADAMDAAGARCDLRLYEGGAHGFYRKSDHDGRFHPLTLAEITRFLDSLGWLSPSTPTR